MSQHDFDIANQGFPATRSDLNNALQALASASSGATAPSTTYANQFWYDTANNVLKFRNEDNDAWISLIYLDQTNDAVAQIDVDNIRIDGNTISSTDTNGDITLDPNGTGDIIIASGNVGVGTTSPSSTMHVQRASSGGTPTATAALIVEGTDATGCDIQILGDNSDFQRLLFGDAADNDVAAIEYSHSGDNMRFTTNASERLRIDSDGRVLAGVTSSMGSGRLQVDATASFVYCQVMRGNATNAGFVLFQKDDGSTIGSIDHTASATRYLTTSDARAKENVTDMTGAIARIKQLLPKRFNFIDDPDDTTVDGFLAHEAQTVVSNAVSGTQNEVDADGNAIMQGIDHSALVPLLVGALKESISKIETLETQRADLESRVAALEA